MRPRRPLDETKQRQRIELTLSQHSLEILDVLATKLGQSRSRIVDDAILHYARAAPASEIEKLKGNL